jgi:SAM-dependent methyltransferase
MHDLDTGSGKLPEVPYPRLNAMFRLGERVWSEREDLRAAFGSIESWDFWYWLMWHGTKELEEVRDQLYPLPPEYLIHRVVGEESTLTYFRSGLVNWRRMVLCLTEGGFDFTRSAALLDYGCGCGRVIQFLSRYAATCELFGADIDAEAIEWCSQHLDFARFLALTEEPPSPFSAGQFDGVCAFSVFSHLPEDLSRQWLKELHRIMKPGAALVLTVQGREVVKKIITSEREDDFPSAKVLRRMTRKLESRGFWFFPYHRFESTDDRNQGYFEQLTRGSYGSAFVLEPYIRESWLDCFELVAFHAAPDRWQDYVVLRNRG